MADPVTATNTIHQKAKPAVDTTGLTGDQKILTEMRERFKRCQDALEKNRAAELEDLYFVNGEHWLEGDQRDRAADQRPALTVNKLPSFVYQVANDLRQNMPSPKVRPVDNVSDPDTAEVIEGHVRHIFNNGDSKSALNTSSFYQIACGEGYFRILTRYCKDDSFDQELYLSRIENPFSVYFPIHLCTELDYSDAPYCIIRERMGKDDFFQNHPDSDMSTYNENATGDPNWLGEDYIYVAEYFTKEIETTKLYQLSDGTTVDDKSNLPDGVKVDKERDVEETTIKWRKVTQFEVLEEKDFPGKYIPVIPVLAQEICINGKKSYISLVRFAKDPQKMYDYWVTAFTEQIALQPKAPFIAAVGQVEGRPEWQTANRKNHSVLQYHPVTEAGSLLPPPQRSQPPTAGQALFQGIELATEQLKEVTGIYDASLGGQGNETTGKAIISRQKQGQVSNYHFGDNFANAIRYATRILIDLIPEIYDTERSIRILGEDMTDKVVTVNRMHPDDEGRLYDITVGQYDVVVDVGPSYATKRVETAQNLVNITQAAPQSALPVMDILYRSLDFPYAQEAAERMKRFINAQLPGVIADNDTAGGTPSKEQMQAMVTDMQKLMQAHQMTMAENKQLHAIASRLQAELNDKHEEQQVKADTAVIKANTEIQKAKIGLQQAALGHQVDLHKFAVDTQLRQTDQQMQAEAAQSAAQQSNSKE